MPKENIKQSEQPSKPQLKNKIIGILFILLSLFILLFPSYLKYYSKLNPVKVNFELKKTQVKGLIPDRIVLPGVNIDIAVKEAKIVDGYWQVFDSTASYGQGSAALGEKGNTVIFAHARDGLFYNLKNVKENDLVFVYSKNKKYTYKVTKIISVFPNQAEVIAPTKNETLTLYTCTGFYDEKRLVVVAQPQ